jgi:hypothetical protein
MHGQSAHQQADLKNGVFTVTSTIEADKAFRSLKDGGCPLVAR